MYKPASKERLTARPRQRERPFVEILIIIIMYGADAYLFRRWLPPFVSAIIAALVVNILFLPLFLYSWRWKIEQFFLFILLTGLAIYVIGILVK